MTARIRLIDIGNNVGGTMDHISLGVSRPGYSGLKMYRQQMKDDDNRTIMDKPLEILTTKVLDYAPIKGTYVDVPTGRPAYKFNDFVPTGFGHLAAGSYLNPSNSSSFHVPKVLNLSNPSRPYVDTGTFVGELRDFPGMGKAIWHTANRLYKRMPRWMTHKEKLNASFKNAARELTNADEHFIANQFGWLPFVNDLFKYADVGEVIEKRVVELKNLQQRGSKSRTVTLEELKGESSQTLPIETVWVSLSGVVKRAQSTRVWGSGRYTLEDGSPLKRANEQQLFALARKAAMGLTVDGSTAWNLMPWSWLIDWASNTGDWIEISRNIVGARPSGKVCIMTRQSYATSVRLVNPPGQKLEGGNASGYVLSRKREVFNPSFLLPEMGWQILTARQSAILGSLATLRVKKL